MRSPTDSFSPRAAAIKFFSSPISSPTWAAASTPPWRGDSPRARTGAARLPSGGAGPRASPAAAPCAPRKLIGSPYFNKGYLAAVEQQSHPASTRDTDGHGTHTLSTAAGRFVPGGVPGAHVAAYKVCWSPVNDSDAYIIAEFDAAIHDGVHGLSVSLGGFPLEYLRDGAAIESFHAARHGVTVVCCAGNSGPAAGTVSNTALWLVTVGGSTMDRRRQRHGQGQTLSPVRLPGDRSESAYIPTTALDTKPMSAFSSQGPNTVTPQILIKSDITAPGVSILAASTGLAALTSLPFDDSRVIFNSESGSSMLRPCVAGIAGLLTALHPDWTARVQENMSKPMSNSSFLRETPFGYGAGHVQPNRAADIGLVYDANATDYLGFLCGVGYSYSAIATVTGTFYRCNSFEYSITCAVCSETLSFGGHQQCPLAWTP